MNAIRISREPTQAFVQYMAWEGSGYTSFFNPFLAPKKNKKAKPTNQKTTLVFRIRSKKLKVYVVITKSIFKMGLNAEAVDYWLPSA